MKMDMPTYYWLWQAFVGWKMMYCFLKGRCPEINPTLQEHSTTSIQDIAHSPPLTFSFCLFSLEFTEHATTQTGKDYQLSHTKISCGMNVVLPSTAT